MTGNESCVNESSVKGSYVNDLYRPGVIEGGEVYSRLVPDLPAGSVVLEVGCGGGHFSEYCRSLGLKVVSSDLSVSNVCEAGRKYPDLALCAADAERLPFKTGSLDAVVSIELVEHLFGQEEHLREVARVLRDGGVYVIKTPNKLYDRLVNFPYFMLKNRLTYSELYNIHPSTRTLGGLKQVMEMCGFRASFYTFGRLSLVQRGKAGFVSSVVEGVVFKLFPLSLQPSLICVAVRDGRGTI